MEGMRKNSSSVSRYVRLDLELLVWRPSRWVSIKLLKLLIFRRGTSTLVAGKGMLQDTAPR